MRSKISDGLAQELQRATDDLYINVVIELHSAPSSEGQRQSRADAIAAMRSEFAEAADPVLREVRRSGGEVIDEAWINRTLRTHLPAAAVARIADMDQVAAVGLPTPIAPD